MNTIAQNPFVLSQILGAAQVGDLAVEVRELGGNGIFELGSVMALGAQGKMVLATDATAAQVYGILCEERWVVDAGSDRRLDVPIARHGSFKAEMLHVAQGSSLRSMVSRLRDLGIYLEGIEAAYAPPFRIRTLMPTWATVGDTNVALRVFGDGSFANTARIWFDGAEVAATTFVDYTTLSCTLAGVGGEGVKPVQVRDGTDHSNIVNFEVRPANP